MKNRTRKIEMAVLVVGIAIMLSLSTFPTGSNHKANASGTLTSDILELRDPNVENPPISISDAITIINNHPYVSGKLVLNESTNWLLYRNNVKDQVYWECSDTINKTHVDAYDGDITYFYSGYWTNGSISKNTATNYARIYADQFMGRENTYEEYDFQTINTIIEDNTTIEEKYHCIYYLYQYNGFNTTDLTRIHIDPSGELRVYSYRRCLNMPSSTTPVITWEEAYFIADSFVRASYTINENEIYLREMSINKIVQPTYYWDDFTSMWGDYNGHFCWDILLFFETVRTYEQEVTYSQHNATFNIDAINGDIIGGDIVTW